MADLADIRRDYARRVTAGVDGIDPRIVDAFAAVPRERFLGPPPWKLVRPGVDERALDGDDPTPLYDDVLVELDGARGVNNGSPSLHAMMLSALGVQAGDRVLHVGAGRGYYSALLGELAGPSGEVLAVEYDPLLAAAAAAHLAPWANVRLVCGDGAAHPERPVDRVYVNFGVVAPPRRWVDLLRERGALVFPLAAPALGRSPHSGGGVVLRVGKQYGVGTARIVSPCGFVMAEGPLAGTESQRSELADALRDRTLVLDPFAGDFWRDRVGWPRWFV